MIKVAIATGAVHEVPDDLYEALVADEASFKRWEDLIPLGRNEFICWTIV